MAAVLKKPSSRLLLLRSVRLAVCFGCLVAVMLGLEVVAMRDMGAEVDYL